MRSMLAGFRSLFGILFLRGRRAREFFVLLGMLNLQLHICEIRPDGQVIELLKEQKTEAAHQAASGANQLLEV